MIKLLLIAGFLSSLNMKNKDLLIEVRSKISQSFEDEAVCNELYDKFSKANLTGDFLLIGYKGALEMAKAKHYINPFKKLSHFKTGRDILEEAIKQDVNNIELRFLRLTIQVNVPGFLGYHNELLADKTFITAHLDLLESDELRKTITTFIAKAESEGKI